MLFTQPIFLFYFLPIALLLHRLALFFSPAGSYSFAPRLVIFTLTAAFYGFRQPWWLIPFFACIGFDYLWASLLSRTKAEGWRKAWLVASVLQNVLLLSVFKYWGLIGRLLMRLFPGLEAHYPVLLQDGESLSLPPGISFYTFESLSFVIDVYRREITVPKRFHEFFAFIGMFPRFIAGPIVRYKDLSLQMQHYQGMEVEVGLAQFAYGLCLKVLLADNIAHFVGYAFDQSLPLGFFSVWTGVIAYSLQIYFDFSGYSLMAVGLGRCLGFRFPINFNRPYCATSLRDFWRRWHITLSSWLRDYVYISLGGSRYGKLRLYLSLFLTMTIGGLWHGAKGTFLVWGMWHGAFLCFERMVLGTKWEGRLRGRVATFFIVITGWIFFRASSWGEAIRVLKAMYLPSLSVPYAWEPWRAMPIASVAFLYGIFHVVFLEKRISVESWEQGRLISPWNRVYAGASALLALLFVLSSRIVPFLYFQF